MFRILLLLIPLSLAATQHKASASAAYLSSPPKKYYVNDASLTDNIYTTQPGNTLNDGLSPATPKASVQQILDSYALTGGDTVLIDAGTYSNTPLTLTTADDGSSLNAYVVFKGADTSRTIFTLNNARWNVWINRAEFIRFEDIHFLNSYNVDSALNILKDHGKSTVIEKCKFTVQSTATIACNIFFRCQLNSALDMQRTRISGNRFLNNKSNGIALWCLGDVDNSRFEWNKIEMTGSAGRGIVFRYVQSADFFWPVADTVFKNTITSAGAALDYTSSVPIPTPAGSRTRGMMTDHVVSSNTLRIQASGNKSNSAIYLRGCGSWEKGFTIVKNRLTGGYAGIYIEDVVQNLSVQNNYICNSIFGLYREAMSKSDGGTVTTLEDNDGNQFVHNSVYTSGSCLFFGTSALVNFTQADWDVRNNILYTQNSSGTAACLNFQSNSSLNATDNLRYCNSNLFYNAQNDPGRVAKIGSNFYALTNGSWSALSMASVLYVNNDPPNDANSFFYPPNWENPANCDLDLLPDTFWPFNYPNKDYLSASGIKFIYGNLANTDITDNPSRTFATIGAFEAGSSTILSHTLPFWEAVLKDGIVHIRWNSTEGIGLLNYQIEKSTDARNWMTLCIVHADALNSNKDYHATDSKPGNGKLFYRLKTIRKDRFFTYSDIKMIQTDAIHQPLRIFPNPAKNSFLLSGLKKGRTNQIRVMDMTGKLMHSVNTAHPIYTIYLPAVATGMYLIQVNGEEYLRLMVLP